MLNELYARQAELMEKRKTDLGRLRQLRRSTSSIPSKTDYDGRLEYNQRVTEYNQLIDEIEADRQTINSLRDAINKEIG